jgi:hypothetical protein
MTTVAIDRVAGTATMRGVTYAVRVTRAREPDGSFGPRRLLHVLGTGGRPRVGLVARDPASGTGELLPAAWPDGPDRTVRRQEAILRAIAAAWWDDGDGAGGTGT